MDIPVYLFTGFLEAGKTKFIQETLEDPRFSDKNNTLLLLCEEGFTEYHPEKFVDRTVKTETLDSEDQLTEETLTTLVKKHKAHRVIVEYNGMWPLSTLFGALPKNFVIYQEFFFADATTFETYNANMRSLVVDRLNSCELVIFNRFNDQIDKMALHKIVRGVSRRADIAYEYADGSVAYDDIEDPLPFDIQADVITLADADYALWYRDMSEEMQKYDGKTVKFRGIVAVNNKMAPNEFAVGRHVMTCCVQDITYAGLVCENPEPVHLKNRDWVMITAVICIKKHKVYGKPGPVLEVKELAATSPADPEVATFS